MNYAMAKPLVFACQDAELMGMLHPAEPTLSPVEPLGVLIVVGGPQYRAGSHRHFVLVARYLAAHGYPVMRFDYRGMGDSSGRFAGFEDIGHDVRSAIDTFMRECPELQGVVLFGLCDAATAALMYCAEDARVRRLILLNPWARTASGEAQSYLRHYYGRRLLQASFWRKILAGEFRIGASLADLLGKLTRAATPAGQEVPCGSFIERALRGFKAFDGRTLLVLSERDLTAREFQNLCDSSPQWRAALARPSVAVERIASADHTFSTDAANGRLLESMVRWLRTSAAGLERG